MDLAASRIMVTGGAGFLGRALCARLARLGCREVFVPRSARFDLRTEAGVARALAVGRPEVVLHLAARVGGIGANLDNPGRYFYENALMGIQLIEHCRRFRVRKLVVVGSVCSYPKHTPVPFREADLWGGYPEETNAPYGLAKKMLLVQCQAYRQQYGFNGVYLLPVNLYGPGDNFDPETSHVIPAMIRKFVEAREEGLPQVALWGDGSPTREFLHVHDAARGLALAAQRYDGAEPVNLGSGHEVSMRELAERVRALTGFEGEVVWQAERPNGQPRRCLDTRRAERWFGFRAEVPLERGLRETVRWYRQSVAAKARAA
jgi:GDP-L-fucose synthase